MATSASFATSSYIDMLRRVIVATHGGHMSFSIGAQETFTVASGSLDCLVPYVKQYLGKLGFLLVHEGTMLDGCAPVSIYRHEIGELVVVPIELSEGGSRLAVFAGFPDKERGVKVLKVIDGLGLLATHIKPPATDKRALRALIGKARDWRAAELESVQRLLE